MKLLILRCRLSRKTDYITRFHSSETTMQQANNTKSYSSSQHSDKIKQAIWSELQYEAQQMLYREPLLHELIHDSILQHENFQDALIYRLATKLGGKIVNWELWKTLLTEAFDLSKVDDENDLVKLAMEDLIAVEQRDPACRCIAQAFLYFKGFKAIQIHRCANVLWKKKRYDLAYLLQSRSSEIFSVDIHPAANIGGGLMMDHATGVVIGETSKIGKNCSLLHGVTLGGTGNIIGDRHPKIGNNVMIGCLASILGNIEIGDDCRIGSGTMILKPLSPGTTAVGNPARFILRDVSSNTSIGKGLEKMSEDYSGNQSNREIVMWDKMWIPKPFHYKCTE